MIKILVTGCRGQVGTSLVELLTRRGDVELLAFDKSELDITDEEIVMTCVASCRPDFIINAAAYTAVDKAEQDVALSYAINEMGPKYLASAAQSVGATIIHISTDYVFGGDKVGEYNEEDEPNPQGVYGKSKFLGELAIAKATHEHIILRTAWVFSEHGNNFVKTMLKLAKDRDVLSVVGDQFGGPTYAEDVANAIISIVDVISDDKSSVDFGIYHYSGLPHVSWYEFADAIFNKAVELKLIVKKPVLIDITTEQYPTPAKRPVNSRISLKKIKNNFGVNASDWEEAINNLALYCD